MHQLQLFTSQPGTGEGKDIEKKHRTAYTSRISFKELNESGQRVKEWQKVLELLSSCTPLTSRQIAYMLEVERTNITRTLRDLLDEGQIKVAYLDKCKTTGKKVQYYTAKNCNKSNGGNDR